MHTLNLAFLFSAASGVMTTAVRSVITATATSRSVLVNARYRLATVCGRNDMFWLDRVLSWRFRWIRQTGKIRRRYAHVESVKRIRQSFITRRRATRIPAADDRGVEQLLIK